MPRKTKTPPAPDRIQVYPDAEFWHKTEKHRIARQEEITRNLGPQPRGLSMSSFVMQVLHKFYVSFDAYQKNHAGGWAGYWQAVEDATSKKKGRRS